MHSCHETSMGSWLALCTPIHLVILSSHTLIVLATKQTLLSVLLVNHALFETYFQDEDSQMDTQPNLKNPWWIHDLKSEERRLITNLKLLIIISLYYVIMLCLKYTCYISIVFSNKVKLGSTQVY